MASSEIEPATFRLVAYCLNQLRCEYYFCTLDLVESTYHINITHMCICAVTQYPQCCFQERNVLNHENLRDDKRNLCRESGSSDCEENVLTTQSLFSG
jgi:hypothetical protein